MKNKIFVTILVLGTVFGCQSENKLDNNAKTVLGADSDANNCKASAGYVWSEVSNKCIRIFESGVKFTGYGNNKATTSAAYVVFNKDKSQAEVFSTLTKNPVILQKNITQNSNNSTVSIIYFSTIDMMEIVASQKGYFIYFRKDPVYKSEKLN